MRKLIGTFSENHILTNLIFISVLMFAFWAWQNTPKEEMPEVTADFIYISAVYNGASPTEVEYFVTREIEDAIQGIEGIKEVTSSTAAGSCSVSVELDPSSRTLNEIFDDVESAVLKIKFPEEMTSEPRVRQMKSTNKPVLRVAVYDESEYVLSEKGRQGVQDALYAIENRLLGLDLVSDVTIYGDLSEMVSVTVDPKKLEQYDLSYNNIISTLRTQNVRQPIGQLVGEDKARVTMYALLDDVDKIMNAVIRASFSGPLLRIKDVAVVKPDFAIKNSIQKVNGHEAIFLTVRKTASASIIDASKQINREIETYFSTSQRDSTIKHVVYGDESAAVENRINLIASNGLFGFVIILVLLFVLLNFRSGLWVGMGIPFAIAFGLGGIYLLGYSINNITLAGVIIVLGMLVDDAIVIAENITRREEKGEVLRLAVVNGTASIVRPVLASILTTCIAFVPLYFFSGMMGKFISSIPAVIFLMLGGSLLESVIILPSHMNFKMLTRKKNAGVVSGGREHWFLKIEGGFGKILEKLLKFRWIVIPCFILLLLVSGFLYIRFMRFEQFPREETKVVFLMGEARKTNKLAQTEVDVRKVEAVIDSLAEGNIEMYQTRVAGNRRGNAAYENTFSIQVELVPKEKRKISTAEFSKKLEELIEPLKKDFDLLQISPMRFGPGGNGSGSALEIQVLETDDIKREEVANLVKAALDENKNLRNAEVELQVKKPQYEINIKRDLIQRLGISATDVGSALRTAIAGTTIFYHYRDDVEIPVSVTVEEDQRATMNKVLELPVSARGGYLVPISTVVDVKKVVAPETIARLNGKRVLKVYADKMPRTKESPVSIADYLDKNVFPEILAKYPTSNIVWGGEVKNSRESQRDFSYAMMMVLFLIYFVLCVLFQSFGKPFLIMLVIPFAFIGVILALLAHGITTVGLFTLIGVLGLAGVVVNDSIVMLATLQENYDNEKYGATLIERIAAVSSTRLRAVVLTTVTTVGGLMPTAYGVLGYDSMLADMMLAMSWGLLFGTLVTLILVPIVFYGTCRVGIFVRFVLGKIGLDVVKHKRIRDEIEIGQEFVTEEEEDEYKED